MTVRTKDITGLAKVGPTTRPPHDGTDFRAIRAAMRDVEAADEALREAASVA